MIQYQVPEKEPSKKEIAYQSLRELIKKNELKPGTVLIERNLCTALNISRTPIREAIQQLTNEGLVVTTFSKSSIVSTITYEDISKIYDVREQIEGLAVRLCTQVLTSEQIQELETYYKELTHYSDKNISSQHIFDIDNKFHHFFIRYCRNELLEDIYNTHLDVQIYRITQMTSTDLAVFAKANYFHQKILEGVKQKDYHMAEKAMREHIRYSKLVHLKAMAPNIPIQEDSIYA